jgi:hypothetical protein
VAVEPKKHDSEGQQAAFCKDADAGTTGVADKQESKTNLLHSGSAQTREEQSLEDERNVKPRRRV